MRLTHEAPRDAAPSMTAGGMKGRRKRGLVAREEKNGALSEYHGKSGDTSISMNPNPITRALTLTELSLLNPNPNPIALTLTLTLTRGQGSRRSPTTRSLTKRAQTKRAVLLRLLKGMRDLRDSPTDPRGERPAYKDAPARLLSEPDRISQQNKGENRPVGTCTSPPPPQNRGPLPVHQPICRLLRRVPESPFEEARRVVYSFFASSLFALSV